MKRLNAEDVAWTDAHNGVPRKALIRVGDAQSKLQTINDAKLNAQQSFEPHIHSDSEEVYYFLEDREK